MKNEVYWDVRGSSVFWLYNIQEIKSNFIRDADRSVCWAWPTWGAAAFFRSWPTRFLRDPSKDTTRGWDFMSHCWFAYLIRSERSRSVLSLSIAPSVRHHSERPAGLSKICGSEMTSLKWLRERHGFVCLFHLASVLRVTLIQAFLGNYFLAQWITPWEKSAHLGGKKGTTIRHKKRSK